MTVMAARTRHAHLPEHTPLACARFHQPRIAAEDGDDHHVFPLGMGGPDVKENLARVCPNCHRQVHLLLALYEKWGSELPAEKVRAFPRGVRKLAARGWAAYLEASR